MRKTFALVILSALALYLLPGLALGQDKKGLDMSQMRTYYLVLLLKGPERGQDSTEAAKIQEGHLAHLHKLSQEGMMAMAGPIAEDTTLWGICIYTLTSRADVERLVKADPAVKSGRLRYEIYPWMTMKGSKLP